jgi:hypothetical protein
VQWRIFATQPRNSRTVDVPGDGEPPLPAIDLGLRSGSRMNVAKAALAVQLLVSINAIPAAGIEEVAGLAERVTAPGGGAGPLRPSGWRDMVATTP